MSKNKNNNTTINAIEVNGKMLAIDAKTAPCDKMDFEMDYANIDTPIDGVRYAHIDDKGFVLQVRATTENGRSWWTVKDALIAGIMPAKYESFKGGFVEYDAKIARVELMESLGIDVPMGVAMAYATAMVERKEAIKAKEQREEEVVKAGKDAYVKDASDKAGKRFVKIAERVKARAK